MVDPVRHGQSHGCRLGLQIQTIARQFCGAPLPGQDQDDGQDPGGDPSGADHPAAEGFLLSAHLRPRQHRTDPCVVERLSINAVALAQEAVFGADQPG